MSTSVTDVGEAPETQTAHLRALRAALSEVFATTGWRLAFVVVTVVVALAYTLLLPFDFTQRLELANWDYLTSYQATWSVLLGLGMALVLVVQVHAMRKVTKAKASAGAVGGASFVISLLPSFLCCTPFVPTVLAFVGLSGFSLYSTTGSVQHFFAVHQTEFLAGSFALLLLSAIWGLHKVATASCISKDGCGLTAGGDRSCQANAGDLDELNIQAVADHDSCEPVVYTTDRSMTQGARS
ncbi:MAG: hypothetical protein M1115_04760 [Actinobacteria bacterium]|nr:hypothetical protein [Actinomycetota bacterium]